ncbi:complement decay-accelerating factor transmembrane isoform-like [Heptranchias perlo]|uniref:complement decay-accelerating factor transmembrane isoform-like n=1 Tax=Heptranchias perlo TaxID=212740 RepID=UPI00355A031D
MAERLILALLAISTVGVARVTGDCGKPPQLENGSPNDEYISLTSFPVGAKVRYRCNPGYMFQEGSSKPVTCKNDSTWTPLQAICEPRNCGNPGEILNGYYEATSTTFGSKATFYCDTGYHMVGRAYRLCTADGWDGQVPICALVTCDDLPTISNGITPTPPNAENWEYGMVAEYSCIRGYTLIGAEALTCLETGEWDQPPPACKVRSTTIFKEMIAMGHQVNIKEENMIKAKYQLLESEREIFRLKEKLLEKAEQYVDANNIP